MRKAKNACISGCLLTLKDLFISESCIEIKSKLNFFTLPGIGTLRVKTGILLSQKEIIFDVSFKDTLKAYH